VFKSRLAVAVLLTVTFQICSNQMCMSQTDSAAAAEAKSESVTDTVHHSIEYFWRPEAEKQETAANSVNLSLTLTPSVDTDDTATLVTINQTTGDFDRDRQMIKGIVPAIVKQLIDEFENPPTVAGSFDLELSSPITIFGNVKIQKIEDDVFFITVMPSRYGGNRRLMGKRSAIYVYSENELTVVRYAQMGFCFGG
jgi:hypothetical protein